MPKYLCVQRGLVAKPDGDEPSPTAMQNMYAKFNAWREKHHEALVDLGGKLGDGKLVTEARPTDGPFVEIKELVGGYMIVEASSLDDAVEVARGCPGLVSERSGVEVIEIVVP